MPFGIEALLSQLLIQTHFYRDMNLRLEFSMAIFSKIKSQSPKLSFIPSSFDPDQVNIP